MPKEPFDPRYPVECPNIESGAVADSSPARHPEDGPPVSLAGPIQHIPEFHDCQRLTIRGGRAYGPLVGVWARYQLDSVREEAFRNPTGVPVAELYNFTTTAYPALGIEPGYNCVYLRTSGQWEARMVPQKGTDACPDALDPSAWAAGFPLQVSRHSDAQDVGLVPAAARWDYDESNRVHYIGTRCGDSWCEIGSSRGSLKSSTWYGNRPTEHVKGWYDEQWLAVNDSNGRLVPGPRARLVPVRGLENLPLERFNCRECGHGEGWVRVADATFTNAGAPIYVSKLNLRPGITSHIYLRYRETSTGNLWQARIISGTDTAYKKVLRVDHTGTDVPGTARWQWRENDERAWVRCALGCCSVTEVDF